MALVFIKLMAAVMLLITLFNLTKTIVDLENPEAEELDANTV